MYLLDTDHTSFLQRPQSHDGQRLRFRLAGVAAQMRGWMSAIARAKTLTAQIEAYRWLEKALGLYLNFKLLGFDERAAEHFQSLQKARIRIGTMDLKIAAIALANNATLLSRNLKDFGKVPGLQVEDWSA